MGKKRHSKTDINERNWQYVNNTVHKYLAPGFVSKISLFPFVFLIYCIMCFFCFTIMKLVIGPTLSGEVIII